LRKPDHVVPNGAALSQGRGQRVQLSCFYRPFCEARSPHTNRFGKVTFRCVVCSNQTDRERLSDGTTTSALFHRGGGVQRVPGGITPAAYCSALDQRGCSRSGGRT